MTLFHKTTKMAIYEGHKKYTKEKGTSVTKNFSGVSPV